MLVCVLCRLSAASWLSLSSNPEQRVKELEVFVHKLQQDLEKVTLAFLIWGTIREEKNSLTVMMSYDLLFCDNMKIKGSKTFFFFFFIERFCHC